MGLLRVIFLQPPNRFWVGGDMLSGDWRTTYMAIGLLALFLLATYLPLTQELLRLAPLNSAQDYLTVLTERLFGGFCYVRLFRSQESGPLQKTRNEKETTTPMKGRRPPIPIILILSRLSQNLSHAVLHGLADNSLGKRVTRQWLTAKS